MRRTVFTIPAFLLAACVSPPPTYEDRQRIPPFIVAGETDPPLSVVHRLPLGQTDLELTVPFFSEDLGEAVIGLVYVDAQPGEDPRAQQTVEEPASTYEVSRFVSLQVEDLSPGCHAVMVALTHASNITRNLVVIREERVARAVFWIDVPVEGSKTLLESCPRAGEVE